MAVKKASGNKSVAGNVKKASGNASQKGKMSSTAKKTPSKKFIGTSENDVITINGKMRPIARKTAHAVAKTAKKSAGVVDKSLRPNTLETRRRERIVNKTANSIVKAASSPATVGQTSKVGNAISKSGAVKQDGGTKTAISFPKKKKKK